MSKSDKVYKLVSRKDFEGNDKELLEVNKQADYIFQWLELDSCAIIVNINKHIDHSGIRTSYVTSIIEEENSLIIGTRNTVYRFDLKK